MFTNLSFVTHTLDHFDISECNLTSTTFDNTHINLGYNTTMTCNATEEAILICGTNDVMGHAHMEEQWFYSCSEILNTTCQ